MTAAVLLGTVITLVGCSDEGTSDDGAGSGGTSGISAGTSGTAGSAGTNAAGTAGAATGGSGGGLAGAAGAAGTSGSAGNGGVGAGGAAGNAGSAGSLGGAGAAGVGGSSGGAGAGAGAGGMAGGGMAGGGMGGAGTSGGAGASGAAGSAGGGAEDFDPQPDDFTCIADWQQVLGFRITNALGRTEEAIAVAEGTGGEVYPVGTIIQHLPTEAMVKRRAGFSPETRDWEFFLLELSQDGQTTIAERGTTEIETAMGDTCASCHSLAPPEFDFVCNTYGDEGGGTCGFDFMQGFLDQQLATDTRCD